MKSLMVQGTSSGSGKTTLVAALCRIFSDAGYDVAPFKSQNMSNYSYRGDSFEISRAQAIQAVAARCEITPDLNPILLKPRGNYYSLIYLRGKRHKIMHAKDYYSKFVKTKGLKLVTDSLKNLEKKHDLIIMEGAGSPAEINLEKFDIANMKIAERTNSPVLLVTDIDRGGSFASIMGTLSLLDKKYQKLIKGFVFNKFRGDIDILRPGFSRLKKNTKKQVFGIIPKTDINIPEEDSIGEKRPKPITFTKRNIDQIGREIDKLSKLVKKNLNISAIERLVN